MQANHIHQAKTPKGQVNWTKPELRILLKAHRLKSVDDLLEELPGRNRGAITQQATNQGVSLKKVAA